MTFEEFPFFEQTTPTRINPTRRRRENKRKAATGRWPIGTRLRLKRGGGDGTLVEVFGKAPLYRVRLDSGGMMTVAGPHCEAIREE